MPGLKGWGYILTVVTVAVWAGLQLVGYELPSWILVFAGLAIFTLFSLHYAEEYTT